MHCALCYSGVYILAILIDTPSEERASSQGLFGQNPGLSSSFSPRSSLRQHGKQHTKGREDKKDNRVKDTKKAEEGTGELTVKEVTLDEKPDLLGPNTASEDCGNRPACVKENTTVIEEDKADKAVIKTTEVMVKPTSKPLILHSTLC